MRSRILPFICLFAILVFAAGLTAQERPSGSSSDPRIGLRAGYTNAGVAARNMELVKNIPKPDGFFNPKSPLGSPERSYGHLTT